MIINEYLLLIVLLFGFCLSGPQDFKSREEGRHYRLRPIWLAFSHFGPTFDGSSSVYYLPAAAHILRILHNLSAKHHLTEGPVAEALQSLVHRSQ
jgi:hypothetical protein